MRQALARTLRHVHACTLSQLESRFGSCLPPTLFAKAATGPNSRHRTYTQSRTFWCFLWQCLQVQAAAREVVRQLQAMLALHGAAPISPEDGAYCIARQRLPETLFGAALAATAMACQRAAGTLHGFLQNRPVKLIDGANLLMTDTPENQQEYPQVSTMRAGCSFPIMKIVVVFSLLSGAVLAAGCGSIHVSEFRLLYDLLAHFKPGDILVADRGFGNGCVLAWLQSMNLDFIARSSRKVDGRCRRRRLGKNDWLVSWKRPHKSAVIPWNTFEKFPTELTVRIVRGSLYQPGFRVRQVTLVTTLIDAQLYPAQDILRAYLCRWRMEMCLDDLKTTLGMSMLHCKSPAMVRKEMLMHLIAHNLIRYTMVQAAVEHGVDLQRLSFKGTLDALRQFTHAMAQARSKCKRHQLWDCLLRTLVRDPVPYRPNRREPRAIKQRSRKYDRLLIPRGQFKDRPKRNVRRTLSRLRRMGLC
jgi:Transposase DDE domain